MHARARIHLTVASAHTADGTGYNVAGIIERVDPAVKSEYIIVGGHADHCGHQVGLLFPGADDNASGSAVVVGIVRAFASLEKKPRRSIVFVLFGGEESELKGSEYFARHLPVWLGKPIGMLNFDMVGEGAAGIARKDAGTERNFQPIRPSYSLGGLKDCCIVLHAGLEGGRWGEMNKMRSSPRQQKGLIAARPDCTITKQF